MVEEAMLVTREQYPALHQVLLNRANPVILITTQLVQINHNIGKGSTKNPGLAYGKERNC